MTFLSTTFEKLANDPSWPDGKIPFGSGGAYLKATKMATLKLDKARLALMVVDAEMRRLEVIDPEWTSYALDIDPSHCAKVKKRVEKAGGT